MTEAFRVKQHGYTESELKRSKDEFLKEMETKFNEKDKTNSANYAQEYVDNFLGMDFPNSAKQIIGETWWNKNETFKAEKAKLKLRVESNHEIELF